MGNRTSLFYWHCDGPYGPRLFAFSPPGRTPVLEDRHSGAVETGTRRHDCRGACHIESRSLRKWPRVASFPLSSELVLGRNINNHSAEVGGHGGRLWIGRS